MLQTLKFLASHRPLHPIARQCHAFFTRSLLARELSSTVIPVERQDMPFVHHGRRPRFRDYEKFKSPRRRASKLFEELNNEACVKAREANPKIWQENIRVGDSVELKMVSQGGLKDSDKQEVEKIRGVVLGMVKRGLGSSVILRDVVYGLPIERKIPMYSPMIKDATVLERNFIFKGKKKVKRAKLYYFRDRNPLLTKVSKY
jgi:large subunit ribosomal protein L19